MPRVMVAVVKWGCGGRFALVNVKAKFDGTLAIVSVPFGRVIGPAGELLNVLMLESVSVPAALGTEFPSEMGGPSSWLSVTNPSIGQLEPRQFPVESCGLGVLVSEGMALCLPVSGAVRLSAVAVNAAPARSPITNHNDLTTETFFRLFTIVSCFLLTKLESRDAP